METEPSSWWREAGRSLVKCLQSKQREGLAGGRSTSVHTVHSHRGRVSSAPAGRCWSCVLLSPCLPGDPHPLWHKAAIQCHHYPIQRGTNLRSHLYRSGCRKPLRLAYCTSSWYQYKWTSLYCMLASEATIVCGGF